MLYPGPIGKHTKIMAKEILFMEMSSISKQIDQLDKTLKSDDPLSEIILSWKYDLDLIRDKTYKLLSDIEENGIPEIE